LFHEWRGSHDAHYDNHIEGDGVQHSIVTEGFLFFVMGQVMFLDPSRAEGAGPTEKKKLSRRKARALGPKAIQIAAMKRGAHDEVQGTHCQKLDLPET